MKILNTAITLTSIALATSVYSAGFQVLEQGASNLGTADAGAVTNSNDDATAAFWNPSSVAFMDLEVGKTMATNSFTFALPTIEYTDNRTGAKYRGDSPNYVPNFYVVHKFDEELSFSFSMTAPYGFEDDYGTDWIGSIDAVQSRILTLDLNPSVSYKVTDWLSLNAGMSVQYMMCKLSSMHPMYGQEIALRGDSWGFGGNAGFTIEYMEGGRIGFQWRSQVTQEAVGTAKLGAMDLGGINASVTMPQTFVLGIYQRLQGDFDQFAVMFDYCFTGWSKFKSLDIVGAVNTSTLEHWKDVSRFSFGFHYYPEQIENLTLRLGTAFDESPVTAQYRTPRIPDSDRVWISAGAGYVYENIKFDVAYAYVMCIGNSSIKDNTLTLDGSYETASHLISLQVSMTF